MKKQCPTNAKESFEKAKLDFLNVMNRQTILQKKQNKNKETKNWKNIETVQNE